MNRLKTLCFNKVFSSVMRLPFALAAGLCVALLAGCVGGESQIGGDRVFEPPSSNTPNVYGSYLAGRFASAERDMDAASSFLQDALEQDPDSSLLLERAFLLEVAKGSVEDAVLLARRIVTREGDNQLARMVLALNAFNDGDYEAARTHLSQGRSGPLNAIITDIVTAWTYAAQGDGERAKAALEKGAQGNLSIFYVSARGHIHDYLGETELAEKDFARAVELTDGRSLIDLLSYGSLLERIGKREEARKLYTDFLKLAPGQDTVLNAIARIDRGEVAKPRVQSPRAGVALAIFNPASYLAQERAVDLPITYLHLALYVDPDFDSASMLLAELYEAAQRWQDAVDAYSAIPKDSVYYEAAQIQAAVNLDRLDRTDKAIALLKERAKSAPSVETLSILGDMLRFREQYEDATEVYDRAIALQDETSDRDQKEDWGLYYARGVALERSGKWDAAEKDFLRAMAIAPNQPLILNYLGYSWIDRGINLDEALKLIQTAVSVRPDDGFIVDSLGWAYYKLGDFPVAVRYLERAVELQPSDPTINDHLGDAYWKVGRTDEAQFQWNHALGLEPEDEHIPNIEQKLKYGLTH